MTEPDRQTTAEQPTVQQPEVSADTSTDRPGSTWSGSGIPSHLGRARTSTVVLAVLFLAIGTLYLNIRPDPPGPTATDTGTEQPAETTDVPETTAPEETPEPTPTDPAPTTGSTSIPAGTPTGSPDGTTSPEETPDEDAPTTSVPAEETGTGTGTGTAPG
jgi:hypothetical protein